MDWLLENWPSILIIVLFIAMHLFGQAVTLVMVGVIVNEARMKEKKTRRKLASRTRVQAGISTERLNSVALGN